MVDITQDIVDEHFRPYVRALGNLVITFAQCEAALLDMVAVHLGDEKAAVAFLKDQDAKDRALCLVATSGLVGWDLEEMQKGIRDFWDDKEKRNRLVHDDWYPRLAGNGPPVGIRGITRAKQPVIIHGDPDALEIWALARRFREYDGLFSHRAWALRSIEPDESAASGDFSS